MQNKPTTQTIRLVSPQDKGKIAQDNSRFLWERRAQTGGERTVFYALTLFVAPSGPESEKQTRPKPILIWNSITKNFLDFPARAKGLRPGITYWWQIRAFDQDGQILGVSDKQSFRVETSFEKLPAIEGRHPELERNGYLLANTCTLGTSSLSLFMDQLLPPPPSVWGKPVRVRARSGLDQMGSSEPTIPEDGPGTIGPLAMVWGGDAGEIYLPVELVERCSVHWDLSGVEGCEAVLFQVSGQDGFSEPSNGNVMEDESVVNYYWGPPRITCGAWELNGPTTLGTLIPADRINLFDQIGGSDGVTILPGNFDIMLQLRVIPCNGSHEQVDVASEPFTVHAVRCPTISAGTTTCEWTWGDNPGRQINFSLRFEGRYPNVDTVPAPTAPSTLLIWARTCENVSLTMNGETIERRNLIATHPGELFGGAWEAFVVELHEWPGEGEVNFTLSQEWLGWSLIDFLEPRVSALVIPGIAPTYNYCGGVYDDFDSLYGRGDLPELATLIPFNRTEIYTCREPPYFERGRELSGVSQFNDFMDQTFRGTRRVIFDGGPPDIYDPSVLEDEGTEEVTVNFETGGIGENRYVVPRIDEPVMMHEQRASRELIWEVRVLDGHRAALFTTNRTWNIMYGNRRTEPGWAGRSRFERRRMEIWLSINVGYTSEYREIYADIHYDLTAD